MKTGREIDGTYYIVSFYYKPIASTLTVSAFNLQDNKSLLILKVNNFVLKKQNYREQDKQLKEILNRITINNNELLLAPARIIL